MCVILQNELPVAAIAGGAAGGVVVIIIGMYNGYY